MNHSFSFEGIGTNWQIDFELPQSQNASSKNFKKIKSEILKLVESFDLTYSRFRDDSLVSEISKIPDDYKIPDSFEFPENSKTMFEIYWQLYQASKGKFTPLIGQVLADAGYDESYSLKPNHNHNSPPDWEKVMSFKNKHLTVKKSVLLDFGAVGKGYLVDLIAQLLIANNVEIFCIDASGDIRHQNPGKSIKIGLENPSDPNQVIGVAEISDQSLCASAGNRRRWAGFHHIIDAHTLLSPTDISAVWVTTKNAANNTAWADGLSTALFLAPADDFRQIYDFEYVILYQDMSVEKSKNFPGELFINEALAKNYAKHHQ